MNKILVLLSTYNGEKYLSEQLDSILQQQGVEVFILARDDGSSDNTIDILNDYARQTSKIEVIEGKNLGVLGSFFSLMKEALKRGYDYYAFCDQDDIWLNDKLKVAIDIIKAHKESPALYMGAYQMVDEKGQPIPTSINYPMLTVEGAMASNCATGCTMVFNRTLLGMSIIEDTNDVLMHDYWMYMVCLLSDGFTYYDVTPHIHYRQHGNNVIGGKGEGFLNRWIVRIKKVFSVGDNFKSKFATKLLHCYGDIMSIEKKHFLESVANVKSMESKLRLIINSKFIVGNNEKKMQLLGLIITGKL